MDKHKKQPNSADVFTILCKQQEVRDALFDMGRLSLADDAEAVCFGILHFFNDICGKERMEQLTNKQ